VYAREQLVFYSVNWLYNTIQLSFDIALLTGSSEVHLHASAVQLQQASIAEQLCAKDLPKVPTWQLEWNSNLRPSGRKALNPPLSHQVMVSHWYMQRFIYLLNGISGSAKIGRLR